MNVAKDSGTSVRTRRDSPGRLAKIVHSLLRSPVGLVGFVLVLAAVLSAVLAPWLAPYDPNLFHYRDRLVPPAWAGGSLQFPLGTDQLGRDILSRLLFGAQGVPTPRLSPLCSGVTETVASGADRRARRASAARWTRGACRWRIRLRCLGARRRCRVTRARAASGLVVVRFSESMSTQALGGLDARAAPSALQCPRTDPLVGCCGIYSRRETAISARQVYGVTRCPSALTSS